MFFSCSYQTYKPKKIRFFNWLLSPKSSLFVFGQLNFQIRIKYMKKVMFRTSQFSIISFSSIFLTFLTPVRVRQFTSASPRPHFIYTRDPTMYSLYCHLIVIARTQECCDRWIELGLYFKTFFILVYHD